MLYMATGTKISFAKMDMAWIVTDWVCNKEVANCHIYMSLSEDRHTAYLLYPNKVPDNKSTE